MSVSRWIRPSFRAGEGAAGGSNGRGLLDDAQHPAQRGQAPRAAERSHGGAPPAQPLRHPRG